MYQLQPRTHNLSKLTKAFKQVLGYSYYNLSSAFCVGFWHWECFPRWWISCPGFLGLRGVFWDMGLPMTKCTDLRWSLCNRMHLSVSLDLGHDHLALSIYWFYFLFHRFPNLVIVT